MVNGPRARQHRGAEIEIGEKAGKEEGWQGDWGKAVAAGFDVPEVEVHKGERVHA